MTLADGMLADANKDRRVGELPGIGWATIIALLSRQQFILPLRLCMPITQVRPQSRAT